MPHTVPPVPTETSIAANENDIEALIRSCSHHAPVEDDEIKTEGGESVRAKAYEPRTDRTPRSRTESINNKRHILQNSPGKQRTGTEKAIHTNTRTGPQNVPPRIEHTSASLTPEKALERALQLNPDLREWLVHTDYYNVEARIKKLERHRKLKALAAEKERIEAEHAAERERIEAEHAAETARLEAEHRKLLEEEGLEFSLLATPTVETAPTNRLTQTLKAVVPKRERERSVDVAEHPPEKKLRSEMNRPRPMDTDNEYSDRHRERGRPEYSTRQPAPSRSPGRYRAPSRSREHRLSRPSSRDRDYKPSRSSPRPRSRDRSDLNKYDGRDLHKHDSRSYHDDDRSSFADHRGEKAHRTQSPRRPRKSEHLEYFNTGKKGGQFSLQLYPHHQARSVAFQDSGTPEKETKPVGQWRYPRASLIQLASSVSLLYHYQIPGQKSIHMSCGPRY